MKNSLKRYLVLINGTVLLLFLGMIYAWSIFVAPLEADFGWDRSQTSLIFVISIVCFTIGNVISGQLLKKFTVRHVFVIAAICLFAGFFGASKTESIMQLYLCYGVITSCGIGLAYNGILPTVVAWFPDCSGFASGVLLMGYGFGGFLLGPVISKLLYSSFGWRNVFLTLSILFSILVLLSTILIRKPAADVVLPKAKASKNAEASLARDVPSSEMVKKPSFYLFFIWMFLLGSVGLGILGIGATLPLDMGCSAMQAAFIVGIVSVGNGMGRLLGGFLCDKFGRKKTMVFANSLFLLVAVLLIASQMTQNIVLLTVGYFFGGMSFGSILLIMTYYCKTVYGLKYMGLNFALINCYGILSVFTGSFGGGKIYVNFGSYLPMFQIAIGFIACAAVVMVLLNKTLKKELDSDKTTKEETNKVSNKAPKTRLAKSHA